MLSDLGAATKVCASSRLEWFTREPLGSEMNRESGNL